MKKVDKIFKNSAAEFKFDRDLLCVLCSGIFSASGLIISQITALHITHDITHDIMTSNDIHDTS